MGCSPWGPKSRTRLSDFFHFPFSCIGEGNGNPLQCSCLENPRDGGAWWAALSGVAQGWTGLKRVSSSSRPELTIYPRAACFQDSLSLQFSVSGLGSRGGL